MTNNAFPLPLKFVTGIPENLNYNCSKGYQKMAAEDNSQKAFTVELCEHGMSYRNVLLKQKRSTPSKMNLTSYGVQICTHKYELFVEAYISPVKIEIHIYYYYYNELIINITSLNAYHFSYGLHI